LSIRISASLALATLLASTLCAAADDPFCGKWKLNLEKSKFTGEQMKIEDLGGNKYKWTFGDNSDTVTADGTDQPIHYGQTMSLTPEGDKSLKMVVKKDGKVLSSMTHTLSDDGKTQTIKGTDYRPDGSTSDFDVVDKRVGSGSGWSGTWESTKVKIGSPEEWDIEAYDSDGLTFNSGEYKEKLSMKFDGKDYTAEGPNVPAGAVTSGKRLSSHRFEMTDKIEGKVTEHTIFDVSPDGKMMTLTVHETGQPKPLTIIYDKM
jgi:hypothetical protein